ncbi:MAG: FG-GAP-like repeat-containing protein, partial [Bacteroidota bacterium]
RNDNGTFTDITRTHAKELIYSGMVTDAVWTDYDQDGQTDLLLVGEWMPLTFLKNDNGFLKKQDNIAVSDALNNQAIDHTGWWYSVHAQDFDGDGDEDFIVGNLGLNYKYQATQDEPFEVHYDDFDKNGQKDIVLSYYNFGEQYPLRGRSCSAQQIPELKEKFGSYNIFASSNLSTVYTATALEQALHYSAKLFASVYVENKGNGKFIAKELPKVAQISAINAILSDDYNSDGYLDILVAGNLYTAEIETPRNDSGIGLLLLGDGKGNFAPVSPMESGVVLPYDVKQMISFEVEGQQMIIVGNNNSAVKGLVRNKLKK